MCQYIYFWNAAKYRTLLKIKFTQANNGKTAYINMIISPLILLGISNSFVILNY